LEALFKGCLLNHGQIIRHICDYVHHHLKNSSFQGHLFWGTEKGLGRMCEMKGDGLEG
jgi:hypothetical protein